LRNRKKHLGIGRDSEVTLERITDDTHHERSHAVPLETRNLEDSTHGIQFAKEELGRSAIQDCNPSG
jgi:hypothetical protein